MMRAFISLIACMCLLLCACKKEPGVGGKSEIRGYVFQQQMNNNTGQPVGAPYALPEARVYIFYGDHDFYDDDIRTGPDGLFVFSWLREGNYRVYAIGDCNPLSPDCPSGQTAVNASVSASGSAEVKNVGTLTVQKW
jgi:hypothetical protein